MRLFWLILGWLCVVIGAVGLFLPVMPTVPFLLLAVLAFARSDPRRAARIMRHPKFGPPIRAFRKRGVVGRMAKVWAITAMSAGVIAAIFLGLNPIVITIQASICAIIGVWLVTRPEA